MKSEFIDLGCGLDSPGSEMAMPSEPKKSYPCFYFTCDEEIDLPDGEFTFTAKGRRVKEEENTRDAENPRYSYEIEVQGFKPMPSKEPGLTNVGDAFKQAMRKKMKKGEYEDGEE